MSARSTLLKLASAAATISVGGAIAVAVTTPGAASVPQHAVDAVPATNLHLTRTIHLLSHTSGAHTPSKNQLIIAVDLSRGGRTIGSGVDSCVRSAGTVGVYGCNSALGLTGGILLVRETINTTAGTIKGSVVGGSGDYKGAAGTISGTARPNLDVNLTVTYYSNAT
ncbi:MAG TPA: hypothetical protein VHV76_06855 [Mycobacteriales bacterium]|nr:hypothetical protein [Mycobacteriales bacterium]